MSTLKVDTILKRTGTGTITVGQSGNTIDLSNPTSVTLNDTMKLKPAFHVKMSADQSIANNTQTKLQFNSEFYDTDSAFDSSTNYRFTAPSAGKYLFHIEIYFNGYDQKYWALLFKKNGSEMSGSIMTGSKDNRGENIYHTIIDDAAVNDYYEVFVIQDQGGSQDVYQDQKYAASGATTRWYGHKLIGV